MSLSPVHLLSVGTATPPHVLDQEQAAALAAQVFGGKVFRDADLLALFRNTGIATRRTAQPLEWYLRPQDWPARNAAYLLAAETLYEEAARKALAAAGVDAAEVGAVVTVSSTGIATPSLEARLHGRLGLAADVLRAPLFGLGCAGGVSGLAVASRLAASDPKRRPVLMVAVELCSLAVRMDEASKTNVVATALFGDGAAAAVLRAGEAPAGSRPIVGDSQHLWPDTLDIMGWTIDPSGFGVVLAATLPAFVAERFHEAAAGFAAHEGRPPARYVCHPGGARVLPALERVLELDEGALDVERAVLREFGNMSAPTVYFVLERVLADGPSGPLTMAALGPGFTATFVGLGARA